MLRRVYHALQNKHSAELAYWKKCYRKEGESFSNTHYEKLMLAMAQERDQEFMREKVVADFGCGPRGSLAWVHSAKVQYGIDVLIPQYLKYFYRSMRQHGMIYISCDEHSIPMPDDCVDIIYSLNALDHVQDLPAICQELRRILAPGGEIIGSFNLYEASTAAEPQSLSPEILEKYLLKDMQILHQMISAKPPKGYLYQPLIEGKPIALRGKEEAIMWVRAKKAVESMA